MIFNDYEDDIYIYQSKLKIEYTQIIEDHTI